MALLEGAPWPYRHVDVVLGRQQQNYRATSMN